MTAPWKPDPKPSSQWKRTGRGRNTRPSPCTATSQVGRSTRSWAFTMGGARSSISCSRTPKRCDRAGWPVGLPFGLQRPPYLTAGSVQPEHQALAVGSPALL